MRAIGWVLLLLALMAPESAPAQTVPANPDAVAVIIGNRTYHQPGVPAVEFAHNDAAAMRRHAIEKL
ncbi:MAG: hypothetical protein FJX55_21265, partial [Alphaproteobacteria bacterium]|nr:hypothetical protein [Alphaproteobacteria bacterium]